MFKARCSRMDEWISLFVQDIYRQVAENRVIQSYFYHIDDQEVLQEVRNLIYVVCVDSSIALYVIIIFMKLLHAFVKCC